MAAPAETASPPTAPRAARLWGSVGRPRLRTVPATGETARPTRSVAVSAAWVARLSIMPRVWLNWLTGAVTPPVTPAAWLTLLPFRLQLILYLLMF